MGQQPRTRFFYSLPLLCGSTAKNQVFNPLYPFFVGQQPRTRFFPLYPFLWGVVGEGGRGVVGVRCGVGAGSCHAKAGRDKDDFCMPADQGQGVGGGGWGIG